MVRTAKVVLAVAVLGALVAAGALLPRAYAAEKNPNVIVIDGSTTVGPIAKAFREYYMAKHPEVNITVSESGSGNGAKSLINGSCDIADMSRPMEMSEYKQAVANGAMPCPTVVALDGVALSVHPSNPISAITMQQAADIYTGKITNWNQLGGPNKEIVVISRDTSSGTYETFETKVLHGGKITPSAEYVNSNGQMRSRVQSTPGAIGYLGLGYVDETVKALPVDGVTPERGTVVSGKYPISRPLFMVTNGYPAMGSPLYQFLTVCLSRDGQAIVENVGYIPVTSY